jgi:type III restriction enzyme
VVLDSRTFADGVMLILEIKEYEDDQDRAKHQATQQWVTMVNRWGQLGPWDLHVCHNPQILGRKLEWFVHSAR